MFHIIKHYKYDVIIKLTIPLATYSKSIFVCVWNKNFGFLRIWSHLLKKSLMENFIFCAVTKRTSSPKLKNQDERETILLSSLPILLIREAITGGVLPEKMFLEISQNPQKNTCARVSFLITLQAYKRVSGTGFFLWILRNF